MPSDHRNPRVVDEGLGDVFRKTMKVDLPDNVIVVEALLQLLKVDPVPFRHLRAHGRAVQELGHSLAFGLAAGFGEGGLEEFVRIGTLQVYVRNESSCDFVQLREH